MTEEKKLYSEKLIRYEKFTVAIRRGFAAPDHPDFIELKKWLRDNFKPEFVELF